MLVMTMTMTTMMMAIIFIGDGDDDDGEDAGVHAGDDDDNADDDDNDNDDGHHPYSGACEKNDALVKRGYVVNPPLSPRLQGCSVLALQGLQKASFFLHRLCAARLRFNIEAGGKGVVTLFSSISLASFFSHAPDPKWT